MADASYPDDLRYHEAHDWARIDGDVATFGVTWHAQDALGDIVYFAGPEVGQQVKAGDGYGELESVKAVSDIIAPLAGEVLEVNQSIVDSPESVNDDPYGAGWLFEVVPDTGTEGVSALLDSLMDAAAYEASLDG